MKRREKLESTPSGSASCTTGNWCTTGRLGRRAGGRRHAARWGWGEGRAEQHGGSMQHFGGGRPLAGLQAKAVRWRQGEQISNKVLE